MNPKILTEFLQLYFEFLVLFKIYFKVLDLFKIF